MSWFSRKQKEEEKKAAAPKESAQVALPTPSAPGEGTVDAYRAIVGPYVTEKATLLNEYGAYAFRVHGDANKTQIKKGVESLYKVHVTDVRVIRLPSKVRNVGRNIGVKSGFKKAIVRLKKGDKIDVIA